MKVVIPEVTGVTTTDSQGSRHLIQLIGTVRLVRADTVPKGTWSEIVRPLTD